jgi:hypothetical protein
MTETQPSLTDKTTRWGMIALPLIAVVTGAIALVRNLPFDFFPYFWDGAKLLREVGRARLFTAGPSELPSYALPKLAYAGQIDYAVAWWGFSGVVYVNLCWFLLALVIGLWAFGPRQGTGRKFSLVGYLSFAAGMIALPYVHKYIGMGNPTIQAMTLWLLFLVAYGRARDATGQLRANTVALGLIAALIILTDFPKWAIILWPAICIVEFGDPLLRRCGWRQSLVTGFKRIAVILPLSLTGVVIASLTVILYYHENVSVRLLKQAGRIETIRFALSWNFPLFLILLGGILVLLFVIIFARRTITDLIRREPGILAALTLIGIFSCLIWPRSARMFAPVIPFLLYLFGIMVQRVYDRSTDRDPTGESGSSRQPTQRWRIATAIGTLIVLASFAVRAPYAGACFTLPTGIREMNELVRQDKRLGQTLELGAFLVHNFQLAAPPAKHWTYFPTHATVKGSSLQWGVSGELVEEMMIEEQALHGGVALSWQTNALGALAMLRSNRFTLNTPNDFYVSKWYISETAFQDGHLTFFLRRAANIRNPRWRLYSLKSSSRRR